MRSAAQKLTKTVVDTAPVTGKDYWVWDSELPRFGLRVRASGAKAYAVQYRNAHGTTKRLTIGQPGELWTPDAARKRARELLAMVERGDDPAGDLREKREGLTMREIAKEYLEQYAMAHLRSATRRGIKVALDKHIIPEMGSRKLAEIDSSHVARLHRKLKATPVQANRVLSYLSGIFSYAIEQKLTKENPCVGIKKFQEEKRERYASEEELENLIKAINAHPDQHAANALRLLILTGSRLSEVLNATWDMFDLQRGLWIKPSAHTKQKKIHNLPLSSAAVALIANMYEARDKDHPYLFPGTPTKANPTIKPRVDLKGPWDAIKKEAKLVNFRKHDLRHSYASQLVAAGVPLFDVGKLLGHTQIATTMRYAHLADDPLRAATNKLGSKLAAMNLDKPTAEVVPIQPRRKAQ